MFPPLQCCRAGSPSPQLQAGKLLWFPRGKSEIADWGPYLSRDWKLGTAAQNDFTPNPEMLSLGPAREYLEIVLMGLA